MLESCYERLAADILGVQQVSITPTRWSDTFAGKRVLITGAAGSIGSGVAALLKHLPLQHLSLLDSNEAGLMQLEWSVTSRDPPQRFFCADIRDSIAIRQAFDADRPDIVFHAAALKQLPLLERYPREAALTNIIGTRNVLAAAQSCGTATTVLLSTDKAVNPSTALGLSKRIAEGCCQWLDLRSSRARYVPIRLGNVFGSVGSVVPLFLKQIKAGEAVTLTDPRMRRYFLTEQQASAALLEAAASLGQGTETKLSRGCVLLPDLGELHSIRDIAEKLIGLSGRNLEIRAIGARRGERLEERQFYPHEQVTFVGSTAVRCLTSSCWPKAEFATAVLGIEEACHTGDLEKLSRATAEALAMLQPA